MLARSEAIIYLVEHSAPHTSEGQVVYAVQN